MSLSGLLLVLAVAMPLAVYGGVDLTLDDKTIGDVLVDAVVDRITQACIFSNDKLLLRRIAFAETKDGREDRTFRRGRDDFYGGIWQINEPSFLESKTRLPASVYDDIKKRFKIDWKKVEYKDLWKPMYSALAARARIYSHYGNNPIPQSTAAQAAYWWNNYSINKWTNGTGIFKEASESVDSSCSALKADVVFVVDGSGSIGADNFDDVKKFIADVVRSFDVAQDKIRVGLIEFSDRAHVEFDLSRYNTTTDVLSRVNNLTYYKGGTNSADGLKAMQNMISDEGRHGEGVPVVAVFLTDGQSSDPTKTANAAAEVHQNLSEVTVFAVGVGSGVDESELKKIASSPVCNHVYSLAGFSEMTSFTNQLLTKACKAPALVLPSRPIRVTIKRGKYYYFKIKAYRRHKGVRIKVKTHKGGVKIYVSWKVQNPSWAIYEHTVDVDGPRDDYESTYVPWDETAPTDEDEQTRTYAAAADDDGQPIDTTTAVLYAAVEGKHDTDNEFELNYNDSALRVGGAGMLLLLLAVASWLFTAA